MLQQGVQCGKPNYKPSPQMGGIYHPQMVGLWHRVSHIIHPSISALGKVAVLEDHFQQIIGDTPTR